MRNVNNPPRPGSKRLRRSRWAKSLSPAFSSLPRAVLSGPVARTSSEPFTEEQIIHLTEPQRSLALVLRMKIIKLALGFALRGDICCLRPLLRHGGIDLSQWVDEDGRTVLSHAAENGPVDMVSYLAEEHNGWAFRFPYLRDLGFGREENKGGTRISLRATGDGRRRAMKFLLRDHDSFSILAKDNQGRTPLSWAAGNGHWRAVEILLQHSNHLWSYSIAEPDNQGRTPLSLAAGNGHWRAVEILLQHSNLLWSYSIAEPDNQGRTPLSWAAGNGHQRVVEILLRYGNHLWSESIPETDKQGRTPLSWAAGNGHLAVAELLVQSQRASLATVDKNGWTPLNWAWENGDRPLHEFLLSRVLADQPNTQDQGWDSVNGSEKGLLYMLLFDHSGGLAKALHERGITICGVSPTNDSETSLAARQRFVLSKAAEHGWPDLVVAALSVQHGLSERWNPWSGSCEKHSEDPGNHWQSGSIGMSSVSLATRNNRFSTLVLLLNDSLKLVDTYPNRLASWWTEVLRPILTAENDQLLGRLWNHEIFSASNGRDMVMWWHSEPCIHSDGEVKRERRRNKCTAPPLLVAVRPDRYKNTIDGGRVNAVEEPMENYSSNSGRLCRFCQRACQRLLSCFGGSSSMEVSIRQDLRPRSHDSIYRSPVALMKMLHDRCDMCSFLLLEGTGLLPGRFTSTDLHLDQHRNNNATVSIDKYIYGSEDAATSYFYRHKDKNAVYLVPERSPCQLPIPPSMPANGNLTVPVRATENITTDFSDCVAIIKGWLVLCTGEEDNSDHESCAKSRKKNSDHESGASHDSDLQLPKRVISLGSTNTKDIKLIECDGKKISKYAALSHCWGDATHMEKVKTTTLNYRDRLSGIGIEYSVLPPSFRDAARLCRALDIKYLWIDSICIIQNDLQDWQNESAKMTAVYENAFITIAATAASGCIEGLNFNYPRPWHFPQFQFSVGRAGDLKDLRQQPLYKRGWTLQEMELSPRVIHFAADQLYFVCRSRIESTYGQYLESGRALSYFRLAGEDAGRNLWWDWVEDYSRRTLTQPTDKLPAFAGLTKKFQQLTRARPAVGLWMEDIHYGLLWKPTAPRDTGPGNKSGIPSWSWASSEGAILRPVIENPTLTAIIDPRNGLDLRWDNEELTSGISKGILHIRGRLRWFKSIYHCKDSWNPDWLRLSYDFKHPYSPNPGGPVALVDILKAGPDDHQRWHFLVIQPTAHDPRRYTRIAVGNAYKKKISTDWFDGCPVEDVFLM